MERPSDDVQLKSQQWLLQQLQLGDLIGSQFWGTIEIQFKNGIPVVVKKTETKVLEGTNPHANYKR